MQKFENVTFESNQIQSLFWLVAVVASGRSSADMQEADRRGEPIDVDLERITDNRFFAVLALIAVEHSFLFDNTKTWAKASFSEALDAAFMRIVKHDFKSSRIF